MTCEGFPLFLRSSLPFTLRSVGLIPPQQEGGAVFTDHHQTSPKHQAGSPQPQQFNVLMRTLVLGFLWVLFDPPPPPHSVPGITMWLHQIWVWGVSTPCGGLRFFVVPRSVAAP